MKTTRTLSILLSAALTSCAPMAYVSPSGGALVSSGFLSKVAGAAIRVDIPNGAKITIATKGYNGTEVANTAIIAGGTAYAAAARAGVAKAKEVTSQKATATAADVTKTELTTAAEVEKARIGADLQKTLSTSGQ